jgi:hypothetical protein
MSKRPGKDIPIFQFNLSHAHGVSLTSRRALYTRPFTFVFACRNIQTLKAISPNNHGPEPKDSWDPEECQFTMNHTDFDKRVSKFLSFFLGISCIFPWLAALTFLVADFIRYRICSGVPLGVQILTPP